MSIFPVSKGLVVSIQIFPDTGSVMRAEGEIAALVETTPSAGDVGLPASFRVLYEVWGEIAVNRIWKAFSDRKEIDLRIGI